MKFRNPIVPGYNPDPSICRRGDTFYLVNSSFEFFPGVPIRESKNLINWTQTGYVLARESQLPLTGCNPSGGIFAPTIRYHDGMFYMITTNVSRMWAGGKAGNFIVHSESPEGPWSEPAWIDQMGIDPSIFFDDDGSCWYTGTGFTNDGQGIIFFQLDPMTGEILSEKKIISRGSGGKCPEGPHMYKKDGWYYLMLAEGGTEFGHMETIARSRNIDGPFEFNPAGPLMTARNTNGHPIQCTGHADLVDDINGNWWVVSLGTRPIGTMTHHLGRETFLARIDWVDGWPVMRDSGLMQLEPDEELPAAETVQPVCDGIHCDFTKMDRLPAVFSWLRNPVMDNYNLTGSGLLLNGTAERLSTPNTTPTFTGIRQTQFATCSTAVLSADLPEGCSAGITAYGIHTHHYDLLVTRRYGKLYAQLRKHLYDMEMVTSEIPLADDVKDITLKITSDRNSYYFAVDAGNGFVNLGSAMTIGLATEVTEMMTFTGTFIGLFAENGLARFTTFDYTAKWEGAQERRY